jgi:hypothetical protein
VADETEEEEGLFRGMHAELRARRCRVDARAKVVVDGVVLADDASVWLEPQQVVPDAVAHRHESVVGAEEVLRERDVDESAFVRDDVV